MGGAAPSSGFLILFLVLSLAGGTAFALAFNRRDHGGFLSVLRGVLLFVMGFVTTAIAVMAAPLLFMPSVD